MIITNIISGIGVFLILLAYFLQIFNWISASSRSYLLMNVVGSALAGYGSYLLDSVPFMILEGTWCMVSIIGLIKKETVSAIKN